MSSLPSASSVLFALNTPFVDGHWDTHAYSVGLNEFMDYSTTAVQEFDDHAEMRAVAEKIVWRLLKGKDLPLCDTHHPFNLYADPAMTSHEVLRRLAHLVMADFSQMPTYRSYVVSFFHSGGCNREWTEDLLDEFDDWVERTTDAPSDNESDSDSDSDSEESEPTSPFPMPSYTPMLLHSTLAEPVSVSV